MVEGKSDNVEHFNTVHKNNIVQIGVLWKLRNQLMWGMGVFQAVMILVLSLRLNIMDKLNNCGGRPSEELKMKSYKT